MLSLHHLEGGTFTLIEISVIKVLSFSPIPQTKLVSEEHIAQRDTCKNAQGTNRGDSHNFIRRLMEKKREESNC